MSREQDAPNHYGIMKEIRALTYEVDQLRDVDAVRALGMGAITASLKEISVVNYGDEPDVEALLSDPVADSLNVLRGYMEETKELRDCLAIEQGERTRPYSLYPYEELVKVVDVAASHAYFTIARESGSSQNNMRQYPGMCSPVFYVLQHELRKKGIETQHMWWFEAGNNHHFLRTIDPARETLDIDPTWQQYLPDGTDYTQHPRVLIAPTSHIPTLLSVHGVPEDKHRTWLAAKPDLRTEPNWWTWSNTLEAIFDKDPWHPPLEAHERIDYIHE